MLRAISLAAVVLAACSGGGSPAPPAAQAPRAAEVPRDAGPRVDAAPLDQDLARLVELSLAMYREVASAFTAVGEDCPAATARLRELSGRYRDVTAANAKVLHDGRAKQLRAALASHDAEFDAAAQAVVQSRTMSRCAQDPAFGKAFDALVSSPP